MSTVSAFSAYKHLQKNKTKKDDLKKKAKSGKKKSNNKNQQNGRIGKKKRVVIRDTESSDEETTFQNGSAESFEASVADEITNNTDSDSSEKIVSVNMSEVEETSVVYMTPQALKRKQQKGSSNAANGMPSHNVSKKPKKLTKHSTENTKATSSSQSETSKNSSPESSAVVKRNSIVEGENVFQWLINPIKTDIFFTKYWEQNVLLIKRGKSHFFESLISSKAIDQMLMENHVEFTKNIDITSYVNGVRETLNPEGRAFSPVVWDFYAEGCSVRLLNPQTFLQPLYELCATLQEFFHCLVGANAYLTPPNSQGFAPHYDDIEAFVLQVEGRKRWKIYKPRSPEETLPRYSSPNFSQDEIGDQILEEVLMPGDVLYFPRGTIHQACTEPGYHSLHITLSVYQKQSYADLLEKMFPIILQKAIASNVNLRRGLPLHTWRHAGLAYSETDTQERAMFERKVTKMLGECLQSTQLHEVMDAAVDQLAKKYQHEALPPHILPAEQAHTVFGVRNQLDEHGECVPTGGITLRSNVRLLRANILRLVGEENQIRIYYYLDNSKEYCEYMPNFFDVEPELAGSVEVLIKSYPEYVGVSQLPLDDDDSKLDLVTCLWKRGLLMTEKPLKR